MNTLPAAAPQYVGFFVRLIACLIDIALLLAMLVPLGWSTFSSVLDPAHLLHSQGSGVLSFLLNWVLLPAAVVLFWRFRGGTPGKMVFRAEIVDADTLGPPSNLQLVIRYLAYLLSSIVLGLGFVWIIIDARKQAWHDKLARTVVVKRPAVRDDPPVSR